MKLKKIDSLAVSLFKQAVTKTPAGEPAMKKLRGNPKSRLLLLTPPCTAAEYEQGIPFCDRAGAAFHNMLYDYGFDTQKDFLVTTCSAYGSKPNKQSTDLIKGFVLKAVEFKVFDMYVCVGDTAFKYIFGQGKKPASSSLFGSTVYIPETGHKPLFTFPEPSALIEPEGEFEEWQMRRIFNVIKANETKYHKHCRSFVASLKQHKIKP